MVPDNIAGSSQLHRSHQLLLSPTRPCRETVARILFRHAGAGVPDAEQRFPGRAGFEVRRRSGTPAWRSKDEARRAAFPGNRRHDRRPPPGALLRVRRG